MVTEKMSINTRKEYLKKVKKRYLKADKKEKGKQADIEKTKKEISQLKVQKHELQEQNTKTRESIIQLEKTKKEAEKRISEIPKEIAELKKLQSQILAGNAKSAQRVEKLTSFKEGIYKRLAEQKKETGVTGTGYLPDAAEAYVDMTEADAVNKVISSGGNGTGGKGMYRGVIVNNDPQRTVYIPHPEKNEMIKVKPNTHEFLYCQRNPAPGDTPMYDRNRYLGLFPWHIQNKNYEGKPIDFGIRIYEVR